jgi:RNA polymerase primary sigma factor
MGGLANCVPVHPGWGDPMPVVSLLLVEGQIQEDREMIPQATIQRIIRLYGPRGFVTFDQLNELLPSTTTEPEDIEAIMQALSDEGINVVEEDQS